MRGKPSRLHGSAGSRQSRTLGVKLSFPLTVGARVAYPRQSSPPVLNQAKAARFAPPLLRSTYTDGVHYALHDRTGRDIFERLRDRLARSNSREPVDAARKPPL
jgi:hypothetical protein